MALEAKVHQALRRFDLALSCIEQAISADTGELLGRLLLNKAQILDALGDTMSASQMLLQATAYLDEQREPRVALGVRYQLLVNLCLDDRAPEAAPGFPEVRALAERVGEELDLVRVVWLGGAIAAGCKQFEEAEAAFEKARQQFASFNPPIVFDYALVSLDLALLLLEENRTPEVLPLAEETVKLFKNYGIQREALAALQIYRKAAKREAVTIDLTRRVIRFLYRAQHDPELRFEESC